MAIGQDHILSSYPVLDSLQIFQNNALSGNLSGGLRALAKPSEASPEERKKLSARLGIENPVFSGLVDIATNPLVLIGAALTYKFKLPTALEMRAYKGPADQLRRSALTALEGLSPPRVVYGGTPIPYDMEEAVGRHVGVVSKVLDQFDQLWKSAPIPTRESWQRITASLDGLDKGLDPKVADHLTKALMNPEYRTAMGLSAEEAKAALAGMSRPLLKTPLTADELKVKSGIRSIMDDLWDSVLSKMPDDDESKALQRVLFGGDGAIAKGAKGPVPYLEDYFPRFIKESEGEAAARMNEWLSAKTPQNLRPVDDVLNRQAGRAMRGPFDSHRLDFRSGVLMPDSEVLREMGADESLVKAIDGYSKAFTGGKQYDLRPDVIRRYADVAGRINAWAIPPQEGAKPIGRRMSESLTELYAGDANSQMKANMLRNTYIPLLLGRMTPNQLSWSATWEAQKLAASQTFSKFAKWGVLGPQQTEAAQKALLQDRNWTYPAAGQAISNFFYTNTLGANTASAAKNLLQMVTTLAPTVHLEDMATGLRKAFEGGTKFFNLKRSGKTATEAFEAAFPEFHAQHLELDPAGRRALAQSLDDAYETSQPLTAGGSKWHRFQARLMSVFGTTETTNRVVAFYASKSKALRDFKVGIGKEVYDPTAGSMVTLDSKNLDRFADLWAKENVSRTMFGPGVLNRPSAVADWWAPNRQFLSYPLGVAGFVANEATQHPGILGRALLASGAAYGVGREVFETDASDALLFGANPLQKEQRPFAPFPAPPLLSLAGGVAQAAMGDTTALQGSLPTLVPGGVALSRLPGVFGMRTTAEVLGKPYVDYERPTPDGRYALYSSRGALIGYETPYNIFGKALGVQSPSEQQAREATKVLMGAQDRIQAMRRSALEALSDNDADRLLEVSGQWQRAFPGSGELPVSARDIRNIHLREDVTRTERLLESLPPEVRSQYAAALSTAAVSDFQQFLGLTGPLTGGNTINERETFRARPLSQTQQRVGPNLHGVKTSEKLKEAGLNQPEPPKLGFGQQFTGFPGFGE